MMAMTQKDGKLPKIENNNSTAISTDFRRDDAVGEQVGISSDTLRILSLLTQLVPRLMQMADEKQNGLLPSPTRLQHCRRLSRRCRNHRKRTVYTIPLASTTNEETQPEWSTHRGHYVGNYDGAEKFVKRDIKLSGEKLRKYFHNSYSPM